MAWNNLNLTSNVDTLGILDMPFLLESEIEKVLSKIIMHCHQRLHKWSNWLDETTCNIETLDARDSKNDRPTSTIMV